jgi:hypothetical protein
MALLDPTNPTGLGILGSDVSVPQIEMDRGPEGGEHPVNHATNVGVDQPPLLGLRGP